MRIATWAGAGDRGVGSVASRNTVQSFPEIGALAPTINLWFSAGFSPGDDALECLSVSSEAGPQRRPNPAHPAKARWGLTVWPVAKIPVL